jgi:hypothetical protein
LEVLRAEFDRKLGEAERHRREQEPERRRLRER